jgi:hypothetical protein
VAGVSTIGVRKMIKLCKRSFTTSAFGTSPAEDKKPCPPLAEVDCEAKWNKTEVVKMILI